MRCPVCDNETGDLIKCGQCGFTIIGSMDGSEEEKEKLKKIVDEYRAKHWKTTKTAKVYIEAITNAIENGKVVEKNRQFVLIGDTAFIASGDIKWLDESFARQSGNCHLNIMLELSDGSIKKENVVMMNPETDGVWKVGVKNTGDNECAIVLGNTEKNIESKINY